MDISHSKAEDECERNDCNEIEHQCLLTNFLVLSAASTSACSASDRPRMKLRTLGGAKEIAVIGPASAISHTLVHADDDGVMGEGKRVSRVALPTFCSSDRLLYKKRGDPSSVELFSSFVPNFMASSLPIEGERSVESP